MNIMHLMMMMPNDQIILMTITIKIMIIQIIIVVGVNDHTSHIEKFICSSCFAGRGRGNWRGGFRRGRGTKEC